MERAQQHISPFEGAESEGNVPASALVLARNVKRLRTQAKINKTTFALMIGVGRPFLNRVEAGTANPRLSIVDKMAAALDTTPIDLLTEPPDEEDLSRQSTGRSGPVRYSHLW